jgi:hypothetical protein
MKHFLSSAGSRAAKVWVNVSWLRGAVGQGQELCQFYLARPNSPGFAPKST